MQAAFVMVFVVCRDDHVLATRARALPALETEPDELSRPSLASPQSLHILEPAVPTYSHPPTSVSLPVCIHLAGTMHLREPLVESLPTPHV